MGWLVERRLRTVSASLRRTREEVVELDEQIEHFRVEEDDARIRAIVADSPSAEAEHFHAKRSYDTLVSAQVKLRERIIELTEEQDRLLDKLSGSGS